MSLEWNLGHRQKIMLCQIGGSLPVEQDRIAQFALGVRPPVDKREQTFTILLKSYTFNNPLKKAVVL